MRQSPFIKNEETMQYKIYQYLLSYLYCVWYFLLIFICAYHFYYLNFYAVVKTFYYKELLVNLILFVAPWIKIQINLTVISGYKRLVVNRTNE